MEVEEEERSFSWTSSSGMLGRSCLGGDGGGVRERERRAEGERGAPDRTVDW